ncbi:MAG: GNAT family N-acetyltransferase [Sulfitobacter sp.]|nr:GNAT family N-acetyltransferase [Sulfitobacter sp.]
MAIAAYPVTLEAKGLTLRAPTPQDLPLYAGFYAVSDLTVGGYRGGRSASEVEAIVARDIAHWDDKGFGIFLVFDGDTFMGGTGLAYPDDWPCHELTWWLMPDARGRGIATRASRAVINWAYGTLGWDRVETHMRDENLPARRLAQRLDGRIDRRQTFPDGVTRDVFLLPRGTA